MDIISRLKHIVHKGLQCYQLDVYDKQYDIWVNRWSFCDFIQFPNYHDNSLLIFADKITVETRECVGDKIKMYLVSKVNNSYYEFTFSRCGHEPDSMHHFEDDVLKANVNHNNPWTTERLIYRKQYYLDKFASLISHLKDVNHGLNFVCFDSNTDDDEYENYCNKYNFNQLYCTDNDNDEYDDHVEYYNTLILAFSNNTSDDHDDIVKFYFLKQWENDSYYEVFMKDCKPVYIKHFKNHNLVHQCDYFTDKLGYPAYHRRRYDNGKLIGLTSATILNIYNIAENCLHTSCVIDYNNKEISTVWFGYRGKFPSGKILFITPISEQELINLINSDTGEYGLLVG